MKYGVGIAAVLCVAVVSVIGIRYSRTSRKPISATGSSAYHKISPQDAKEIIDSKEVVIVDVRTPQEYAQKHIDKALLVPNESILSNKPALLPNTDATLLVYCRTGRRSAEAAKKLAKIGYTKVYDFGGIVEWPYQTVTGAWEDDK